MPKLININGKKIGEGYPLYFIADIAANHDGDLNRAFKLIELAKEAGADAVKFQNFQADKIVSKKGFETLQGKFSHQASWKKSVYEIYKDASIPFDWTQKLKEKCDEVGIEYFTSPYDFESIDYVDKYVHVYKVGSGDITWLEIIEYIAKKNKPVMIAAGASNLSDVTRAMDILEKYTKDLVLMQCNTNYTNNPENFKYINLRVLNLFKEKYPNTILGLSDHTQGHATVLGAVALGSRVFEKHFTDDNLREGPDHKFAMNPKSWREMVDRANEVYSALGDGQKRIEDNEKDTIMLQRRCLRFVKNFSKGHVLTKDDLFPLRPIPNDGLEPYKINEVIGKKINRDVESGDYVKQQDIL
jgi:sialic acid synthase SpsE